MTRSETFIRKLTCTHAVMVLNCFSRTFQLGKKFSGVQYLIVISFRPVVWQAWSNASWLMGEKKAKKKERLLKESPIAKMWCAQFLTSSCFWWMCALAWELSPHFCLSVSLIAVYTLMLLLQTLTLYYIIQWFGSARMLISPSLFSFLCLLINRHILI